MLRLRPFKACDAPDIVSWTEDETAFRLWSADRFPSYPITAEELNRHYEAMADSDSFYEFTAFDENGPVGHLIMRFTDAQKKTLRFGFVIVDRKKRGRGYGREMLALSIRYAFDILKADRITLGVFEQNEPAHRCYRAAGFTEVPGEVPVYYRIGLEAWRCLEMALEKTDWARRERRESDARDHTDGPADPPGNERRGL